MPGSGRFEGGEVLGGRVRSGAAFTKASAEYARHHVSDISNDAILEI